MSLVLSRKFLWGLAQESKQTEHVPVAETSLENFITSGGQAEPKTFRPDQVYRSQDWSHQAQLSGEVEYYRKKAKVCTDKGTKISVEATDSPALDVILRMAVLKWGPSLNVIGSDEFKAKIVTQAARMSLNIVFSDPKMQKELARQRDQWEY